MKNTNTNTSFFKKVGFVLLFSLFAFSNYGVKGQTYGVVVQTELILDGDRYPNTKKYVARYYVRTENNSNSTKYLSKINFDFSYNTTKLSNPQLFIVKDGNEILPFTSSFSSTQGNYLLTGLTTISIPSNTFNATKIANHTRLNITATSTNSGNNNTTNLIAPENAQGFGIEVMRVYFDVLDNSVANNSPAFSNPSFIGYLADTVYNAKNTALANGFGTYPSSISNPWFLWSYSEINGTTWDIITGAGVLNNSHFGGYTTGTLAPLPVTYSSLSAKPLANGVKIEWTTTNEENNSHFEVERTNDGENWLTIGTVEGNGTTYSQSKYEYMDNSPAQGLNVYRLKQVDWNGDFEYSSNKTVIWGGESAKNAVQIFPNPSANTIQVTGVEKPKVTVYNMAGVVMLETENTNQLDLQHLLRGVYYIQVQDAAGEVSRIRFLKD